MGVCLPRLFTRSRSNNYISWLPAISRINLWIILFQHSYQGAQLDINLFRGNDVPNRILFDNRQQLANLSDAAKSRNFQKYALCVCISFNTQIFIIGVDTNFSHYSVHKPLIPDKFFNIRPELGMTMTKFFTKSAGKYVRAYYSSKVSVQNITANIISAHDDITDVCDINFGVTEKYLARCLTPFQSLSMGGNSYAGIPLKSPMKNKICSTLGIFSLNF
ncbi:unnamed protein product [Blumeria hordei]|uniref:Uncharacterized protein n=2 Tax=Blumeria hordei TaxID=2867405 RepID=A0A383UW92_BLUHO|nr:Putative Bgh specific protein [Blumeria hordei DH14]SZF04613.1 unnamed protein product [Blumeria hordei]